MGDESSTGHSRQSSSRRTVSAPGTVSSPDTEGRLRPDRPAVRQAVTLPAVAGDPSRALDSLVARRGRAEVAGAAEEPQRAEEEPMQEPTARQRGWRRSTMWRQATGQDRVGSRAENQAEGRIGDRTQGGDTAVGAVSGASGGAETRTAARRECAAEPEADVAAAPATAASGVSEPSNGSGRTQAGFGRPRKPLLAAAALVGAVLLGVPLLFADGEDQQRGTSAEAGQDTLLTGIDGREDGSGFAAAPPTVEPEAKDKNKDRAAKEPVLEGIPPRSGHVAAGGSGTEERVKDSERGAGTETRTSTDTDTGNSGNEEFAQNSRSRQLRDDSTKAEKLTSSRTAVGKWLSGTHRMTNAHTGKCLVKLSTRVVGQGSCGASSWQRYEVGDGTYLLKDTAANRCLDTNGTKLYVSSCTVQDTGQKWNVSRSGCAVTLVSKPFGKYVTGWNDGTASASARGSVDKSAKYQWRAPSLAGSC